MLSNFVLSSVALPPKEYGVIRLAIGHRIKVYNVYGFGLHTP